MSSQPATPVIGYTLGDQAGIGPEVILKALKSPDLPRNAKYRLIGEPIKATPGVPVKETAIAAFQHLELAAKALKSGEIDAVVTGPVSKETLHQAGFSWPGQTEFFADRMEVEHYAMCLSGDHLTVGLATTHVALKDVPGMLKQEILLNTAMLLAKFCRVKNSKKPAIALAAFNPHAGENGAFGTEEIDIISPVVKKLQKNCNIASFYGPEVPDVVYREALQGKFDAILAPYHDQGLIPLKMIDFDTAVNITLGLPRPRISPDHGTAYGIAGKNMANHASTLRAFKLAVQLANQPAPA